MRDKPARLILILLFAAPLLILGIFGLTTRWPAESIDITCIDRDGDDLCESIFFPYDCDGDGTTWTSCTGLRAGDRACAYNGERVWTDFANDFACAVDYLEAGGTITMDDGLYPIRLYVCNAGADVGKSCSKHADCAGGDYCALASDFSAYYSAQTYPNGESRGSQATIATYLPSARKTGMKLTAVGAKDANGYRDGIRSGAWILDDRGSSWNTAGVFGPAAGGMNAFVTGVSQVSSNDNYGTTMIDTTCGAANILESFMPGWGTICIDEASSFVTNCIADGVKIKITGRGLNETVGERYQIVDVTSVCDSGETECECGGGSGVLVGVDGISELKAKAASPWGVVERIDERYVTDGITIERVTVAPQNAFKMSWAGTDQSPVHCGDDYQPVETCKGAGDPHTCCTGAGTGNCDDAEDYPQDCDLASHFGYYQSSNTRVQDTAWITPSSIFNGSVDGGSGLIHSFFGPGNVIRPGAGDVFMDASSDLHIVDNLFEGCQVGHATAIACIAQWGQGVIIEGNEFRGIGLSICTGGNDDGLAVYNEGNCSGGVAGKDYVMLRQPLIGTSTDLNIIRGNAFKGVRGGDYSIIQVGSPDAVIEQNYFTGVFGALPIRIFAAAHRTQVRNNQADFTSAWDEGYPASYWVFGPLVTVGVTAGTGPYGISVVGNRIRHEDRPDDGSPDPASCVVAVNDFNATRNAIIETWNIQDNIARGTIGLVCDGDDDPDLEGSWDEAVPVPPIGPWINTLGQYRYEWMGSADGHNSRPTCNAAAEGQLYVFYNVDASSCADKGDDTGTRAHPCYCDGTTWQAVALWTP
jgi:hypothetical protein